MEGTQGKLVEMALSLVVQLLGWLGPIARKYVDQLAARLWVAADAYEVEDYSVSLDLLDTRGKRARYEVRERVRFLRDGVASFYHYGWGTGRTFAAYRVHPGHVAKREKLGSRYRSLIVLPRPQNRGSHLTLEIRRAIRDGFVGRPNWLEVEARPKMRGIHLSVTLPHGTKFKATKMLMRTGDAPNRAKVSVTPEGQYQVKAHVARPPLGELYTLQWDW